MVANFELQPEAKEMQQLADQYWNETGVQEHELEAAAYEAGSAIRNGELTLTNLEIIVRWKSERAVNYLIGNSNESIRAALATVIAPQSTPAVAVEALTALRGIDIVMASAVLAAIFPERYAVLDVRALEALGHARHDVRFYTEYNHFMQRLVECGVIQPQSDLPGPTPLQAAERALCQWARSHSH
jgi:hypothetical protein